MKISLNWVKQYVDLDGLTTKDVVDALTMSGLEVGDVVDQTARYDKFVVADVVEKVKHPNADRLALCKVNDGAETLDVVCGAPNVEAGQKVAFAQVGSKLPRGGHKITKAKIRGVVSNGMICAEDELDIGDDHSGIIVLDPKLKTGTPLADALGLNDVLLEIETTPNRSDALSHYGVARDLSALFDRKLTKPTIALEEGKTSAKKLAEIAVLDPEHCPRYTATVVRGVEIKDSPDWLKNRLISIGARPINNVVDVTNFVLHEIGQPLHAFDLDRLAGKKIVVRKRKPEEKTFVTLDSQERKLDDEALMICDAERPVAVAGVMGGENSEVTPETTNVLIESAFFNPRSVRPTARKMALSTDSSYRFERGTDPDGTRWAAERAAQLIVETGGGEVAKGAIDVYPKKMKPKRVKFRSAQIKRILGYEIPKKDVVRIFRKLGFEIDDARGNDWTVVVPPFRHDVDREIDLIEEAARIYGYDLITPVERVAVPMISTVDQTAFADEIRAALSGIGFREILCNPLVSEREAELSGKSIPLQNPGTVDMSRLRTSLFAGMLSTIKRNVNVNERSLRLFEIGATFNARKDETKSFEDFFEERRLAIAMTGDASKKTWRTEKRAYDVFDLKGALGAFSAALRLDNSLRDCYYDSGGRLFDHYFETKRGKTVVGYGGRVKREVAESFDVDQEVFFFELLIDELFAARKTDTRYAAPPRYPKVFKDAAFLLDASVKFEDVRNFIEKESSDLLKAVTLFDLFEGESIGAGKKSAALSFEFYDEGGTLTDDEVEKEFFSIIENVKTRFNAALRGGS